MRIIIQPLVKKILLSGIFLSAGIFFFFVSPKQAEARTSPCYTYGDVNNSSGADITQADADLVNQAVAGLTTLTAVQSNKADVNDNGNGSSGPNVDSGDALWISQYVNNLVNTFPICSTTNKQAAPKCLPTGDAYGPDGQVNRFDSLVILEKEAGYLPGPFTTSFLENADTYHHTHPEIDSNVNSGDAALVLQYAYNLIHDYFLNNSVSSCPAIQVQSSPITSVNITGSQVNTSGSTNYIIVPWDANININSNLTAPLTWGGYNFSSWLCSPVSGNICTATLYNDILSSPKLVTANYVAPTYTISGNVFVDTNKDGRLNGTEGNYIDGTTTVKIWSGASCNTGVLKGSSSPSDGFYIVSGISAGNYVVCYTPPLPSGYQNIYPTTTPPSYSVTVGTSCSTDTDHGSSCSSGSINDLNFAIAFYGPWIQSTGTDIRLDNGFNYYIQSPGTCGGAYASIPNTAGGGTPGIIFTGDSLASFNPGSASTKNWVVGGSSTEDKELFTPTKGNIIRTSYGYINARIKKAGITPTPMDATCNVFGCGLIGTTHGLYSSASTVSITTSNNLNCTNAANNPGNCVFLINGDLHIMGNITLTVGATATFIVSGSIYVDPSVGTGDINSTTPQVEGFYSADKSFVIQGNNNCGGPPDQRLNIAGSVVVNAAKDSSNCLPGGCFQNNRDLCDGNTSCPVFSIQERPNFILNAPDIIKYQNTIYQELAP